MPSQQHSTQLERYSAEDSQPDGHIPVQIRYMDAYCLLVTVSIHVGSAFQRNHAALLIDQCHAAPCAWVSGF